MDRRRLATDDVGNPFRGRGARPCALSGVAGKEGARPCAPTACGRILATRLLATSALAAMLGVGQLASSALPTAVAQGPVAEPVAARMFATGFTWHAAPGTRVVAELHGPAGVKGRDDELATVNGEVWIDFVSAAGPPPRIEAGDAIVLRADGFGAVTATVPLLAAELAPDRATVHAIAPPGAEVALRLTAMTRAPVEGRYRADADGRLTIPLAEPLVGDGRGELILEGADGGAFTAGFAAFMADIPIGSTGASGWASAGATVAVTLTTAAGAPRGASGPFVIGAGRSWSADLGSSAFRPGDVVTALHRRPASAELEVTTAAVPALNVRVDASRRRILGGGPPGAAVTVDVVAIGDASSTTEVTVGEDGAFAVDLAAAVPPGARVVASMSAGGGLRFTTEAPADDRLVVRMYGQRIEGIVDVPGAVVSTTLRAGDGTVKGSGTTTSAGEAGRSTPPGTWSFTFGGSTRILPGDTIAVDWRAGDPLVVAVPHLTTVADVAEDAVHGTAPAGSTVVVSVRDTERPAFVHPRSLRVDDGGRYRADFAGLVDIAGEGVPVGQPTLSGQVVLTTPNRVQFELGWAAVQLRWQHGSGLRAFGPPGRDLDVVLEAADGTVLGTHHEVLDFQRPGAPIRWTAALADGAGQPIEPAAGDRFRVTVGDEQLALEMPELWAVLFAAEDRLVGRTLPLTRVGVWGTIIPSGSVPTIISDAQGHFAHDLSGILDVRFNDLVGLTVRVQDRHTVERTVRGPGVNVALDDATVAGAHQASTDIAVEQRRSGIAVAGARARTDGAGRYALALPGLTDVATALLAGDALVVSAPDAEGDRVFGLDVPELSIAVDRDARTLSGRAEPGGKLALNAFTMFHRGELNDGSGWWLDAPDGAPIGADGRYAVALPPTLPSNMLGGGPDLRPGQRLQATYTLPTGNIVSRHTTMPIANVELGGARVCGFGAPWQAVEALLTAADGSLLAVASGSADGAGAFDVVLRDPADQPVATAPGQTVSARLGSDDVAVLLEKVEVTMRWDLPQAGTGRRASEISGSGPARRDYYIHFAGARCLDAADRNTHWQVQPGLTNAEGTIRRMALSLAPFPPGQPIEVAFYTLAGHRFFVRADRTLARIHLRTDHVTGTSVPLAPLGLALNAQDGAGRGAAGVTTGVGGAFDARLRVADGRPARIEPGDRLVVTGGQGDEAIDVEDVDFDFSAAGGLFGTAPAGRTVRVSLRLADGRDLAFARAVDADGRFSFLPADLPPRRDWELEDVARVEVVLPTAQGHEIVVGSVVGTGEEPEARTVFLPLGMR